jgi:hypothetical protein
VPVLAAVKRPQACYKRGGRPHLWCIGFWLTRYAPTMYQDCTAWTVVTSPVNGRSPAGGLMRRAPQLLVTSAILGGAEAHSHIAPASPGRDPGRRHYVQTEPDKTLHFPQGMLRNVETFPKKEPNKA